MLDVLNWFGWVHKRVSIHFSTANRFSIRRLKIEASLRRWRRYSIRYSRERIWVERWLHMIDRALTRQPAAAAAIVDTATMVQGYGDAYRYGLADWNMIIDQLAKPTFDGVLPVAGSGRRHRGGAGICHARSPPGGAQAQDRGNPRPMCRRRYGHGCGVARSAKSRQEGYRWPPGLRAGPPRMPVAGRNL